VNRRKLEAVIRQMKGLSKKVLHAIGGVKFDSVGGLEPEI